MVDPRRWTLDNLAEAARLRKEEGLSWAAIARRFGCTPDLLQYRLDPEYAERRRKEKGSLAAGEAFHHYVNPADRPPEEDVRRARSLIPKVDTRDLTGRVMGDPHPERSALGKALATGDAT